MATIESVSPEVAFHIRHNTQWGKLPPSVKESMNNSRGVYEQNIVQYSIANQLVWRTNLVRQVMRKERKYYEDVLQYCRDHMMLYPYHLQDQCVQGLRITPFDYYHSMLEMIMVEQRSYDSLPNFTARDCLLLTGIGRNEYIDIMNKYKSKRFWRRRSPSEFIPSCLSDDVEVQPWWVVNVGYVTEEEIERCTPEEHKIIDFIIKEGPQIVGTIDRKIVRNLYIRRIVYLVILINDDDYIVVPPLKGFVMNRVQGDYFETLLYKVFVSINEHTNISELASVLQIDLQEVKNAVSVFIRLGFGQKKSFPDSSSYHESWKQVDEGSHMTSEVNSTMELQDISDLVMEDFLLTEEMTDGGEKEEEEPSLKTYTIDPSTDNVFHRRIGFLFDSTLTAFLMMGNLSPSLKNHAVTMFEVGKLTDEALDSFMTELDKVGEEPEGEGEAQRYFHHAVTLRHTIKFLRHNPQLCVYDEDNSPGLDLLHCESITKLDRGTLSRLMLKNYSVLVSMAPVSQEVHSVSNCNPPHIGPAIPEMNSIWFKLWLYHRLGTGPVSLLLTRGTRLTTLPSFFRRYSKILLTSWGHDHAIINSSNILLSLNEALTHSAVLLQAYSWHTEGKLQYVTFPFEREGLPEDDLVNHPALKQLEDITDLKHTCGYVTMLYSGIPSIKTQDNKRQIVNDPSLRAREEEISEFLEDLKELGIGEQSISSNKPHPSSPISTVGDSEELPPSVRKLASDWVPLELCFGIPLFSEEANRTVSEKIISHKLFASTSLEHLKHTNRLLAMELMDFITEYQDANVYNHSLSQSVRHGGTDLLSVPLPTRSLLFYNGSLDIFDR